MWWGGFHPSGQGEWGRLTTTPVPARVWATDLSGNSSTGTAGSSVPCCLLYPSSRNQGSECGSERPKKALPARTAGADSWSRAPFSELPLALLRSVVGVLDHSRTFWAVGGGRAWETQLPCHPTSIPFKNSFGCHCSVAMDCST